MALVTDFLPRLRPQFGDVPDPTLTTAVLWALRRFCYRSTAYRADLAPIALTLNLAGPYAVTLPVDSVLVQYLAATQNGLPVRITRKQTLERLYYNWQAQQGAQILILYPVSTSQVYVWPQPTDVTYTINLWAALSLAESATTCPDFLRDEWQETIVAGAAGRLLTQTGRPWSEPKEGAFRLAEFESGASDAALQVERGYAAVARFVKVPEFANALTGDFDGNFNC